MQVLTTVLTTAPTLFPTGTLRDGGVDQVPPPTPTRIWRRVGRACRVGGEAGARRGGRLSVRWRLVGGRACAHREEEATRLLCGE